MILLLCDFAFFCGGWGRAENYSYFIFKFLVHVVEGLMINLLVSKKNSSNFVICWAKNGRRFSTTTLLNWNKVWWENGEGITFSVQSETPRKDARVRRALCEKWNTFFFFFFFPPEVVKGCVYRVSHPSEFFSLFCLFLFRCS